MDPKRKARLEAEGNSVQSITPELAAKGGILMSPGQRRGQSNPATPNSIASPAGEEPPDQYDLQASSQIEEGLEKYKDKYVSNPESTTPASKEQS